LDRKIVILAALGALGGFSAAIFLSPERKGAAVRELFPPEKLQGYVENVTLRVVEPGASGGPVMAWAIAPNGLEPGQVAPTGMWALKQVRKTYPQASRIAVFVAADSAMAEASNWAGLAELRGDAVHLSGGLPTQAQLDSLAAQGQAIRRPTPEDLQVAAAVFAATKGLGFERWQLARGLVGATGRIDKARFASLDLETTALGKVAKARNRPLKEIQATVVAVTRYYWLRAGDPL
jgi:hypothetical protein